MHNYTMGVDLLATCRDCTKPDTANQERRKHEVPTTAERITQYTHLYSNSCVNVLVVRLPCYAVSGVLKC